MRSLGMAGVNLRRKRSGHILEMGMTPMIDCVFLLLVFFMVATTFSPLPALDVNLPDASATRALSLDQPPLFIRVADPDMGNQEGVVLLNDEIVSMDELHVRLLGTSPVEKRALVILAGRNVPHSQVVAILDYAKRAGISEVGLLASRTQ